MPMENFIRHFVFGLTKKLAPYIAFINKQRGPIMPDKKTNIFNKRRIRKA